jgi:hypothetical protein
VGISDHAGHARQGGDFLGSTLGITAGHHDPGFRILAMDAADGGAGILVGGSSDGAGVENHDSGPSGFLGPLKSPFLELAFDGRAIGLGRAATEICDVESGHAAILTQPAGTLAGRDEKSPSPPRLACRWQTEFDLESGRREEGELSHRL